MRYSDFAAPTHRSAEELALVHEGISYQELAMELPPNALVADVGAGGSPFGVKVAALRRDITWINVDPRYDPSAPLAEDVAAQLAGVPKLHNVIYLPGRAEELSELKSGVFDRVYCSAVVPHLAIDSPRLAARAIHRMAQLPKTNDSYVSLYGWRPALPKSVRITGEDYRLRPEASVEYAIRSLRLSPSGEAQQRIVNYGFSIAYHSMTFADRSQLVTAQDSYANS